MNRIAGLLFCLGLLIVLPSARADVLLLNAVTADGSSLEKPVGPATTVIVSVQSAAGSTGVVVIEQKLPSASGWFTVATVINPSATGEVWRGVGGGRIRATVSGYVAGTITVALEAWIGANQMY